MAAREISRQTCVGCAPLGNVPALMVSGDTAPERPREAQVSGLPFLHKPVSAEKLEESILALLR